MAAATLNKNLENLNISGDEKKPEEEENEEDMAIMSHIGMNEDFCCHLGDDCLLSDPRLKESGELILRWDRI